jgi:hypothetical protein
MLIAYLALNWLTNSLVAKSLFVEDFFGRCYVRGYYSKTSKEGNRESAGRRPERRGARSASTFECLDNDHAAWFGLPVRPKQSQPRNLVIGWMSA